MESTSMMRLVSQAIIKLDGARRSIQMYPKGHAAIQKSMEEAISILSKIFSIIPAIALTVDKEGISFGNDLLDMQQPGIKELFSILKMNDIAFIQLQKEITQKELFNFLCLFSGMKDSLGQNEETFKRRGLSEFPHISLKFLDYSALGLSIEENISGPSEAQHQIRKQSAMGVQGVTDRSHEGEGEASPYSKIGGGSRSGQEVVYSLDEEKEEQRISSRTRPNSGAHAPGDPVIHIVQDKETDRPEGPTSEFLAGTNPTSVDDYEALLSTYLNRLGEMEPNTTSPTAGDDTDMDERVQMYEKQLESYLTSPRGETSQLLTPREQTIVIRTFLKNLNPALKKQFESFDFDKILQNEKGLSFDTLPDKEDLRAIFDALRQANEDNKEISPTLITLVKKMFAALGKYDATAKKEQADEAVKIQDQIEKLFERETYEKFVVNAYEKRLKQLSGSAADHIASDGAFSLEKFLQTLEEGHISRQIAHALTALTEEERSPDIYKDYVHSLLLISPDLLQYDAFDWLEKVYSLIRRHGEKHPDAKLSMTANIGRSYFFSPSFISKIMEAVKSERIERAQKANEFFMVLGGESVPTLLELFFQSDSPLEEEMLLHYLETFRPETLVNLARVLSAPDLFLSDHLITLMIRFKDKTIAPFFHRLLIHDDPAIQAQATEILLEFGDTMAMNLLRERFYSKDRSTSLAAAAQVGRLRIHGLAPIIAAELSKGLLTMTDIEKKKAIVRALGEMGDPAFLPLFETIAAKRISLNPKRLHELQAVLFESLDRFPRQALSHLMAVGKGLKNLQVQEVIKRLVDDQPAP